MRMNRKFFIASSGLVLSFAIPSLALANDCVQKVRQCELTCTKTNTGLMDVLNCKVQECAIAKICSASNDTGYKPRSPSHNTPVYEAPTYERRERTPAPSQTNTYTRPQNRLSGYSNSSQTETRSRSEIKQILSQRGGREALKCVTSYHAQAAGTDNVLHYKNNCSQAVNIGYCYSKMTDSSRRNLFKCDATGTFKFSGADIIGPYGVKWLLGSNGAQVRSGVCMKDLVLDGKTYTQPYVKRTGSSQYRCNY